MMGALTPDIFCPSVLDIRLDELAARGVRAVLLDLDNTLLARGESELSPEIIAWVRGVSEQGFGVAIVSNSNSKRCVNAARVLGVPLERNAFKPFTGGLVRACSKLGVACRDAVMIGDQSYTDVLGAHRAGMLALMVSPMNDTDPLHTRVLRLVDRFALRKMRNSREM